MENDTPTGYTPPAQPAAPDPGQAGLGVSLTGMAEPAQPPAPEPYAHLPEDLRVPWTWMDLLISFLFTIAILVGTAPIVWTGLQVWGAVAPVEDHAAQTRLAIAGVVHTIVVFGLVIVFLGLLVRFRYGKPFWKTIGFREFRVGDLGPGLSGVSLLFLGMLLSFTVASLSGLVHIEEEVPVQKIFEARESAALFLLAAVIVAPLVEETLFRGWLYPVVARSFGVVIGVLVTGGLFGLMHGAQLGGHWQLIGLLTLVGVVLTWVRARTGSVLSSYFLHLGYNSLISVSFFIGTQGLRNLPSAQ